MKQRMIKVVAGACVAGMVAGVPGVAMADQVTAGESSALSWSAPDNMNIALYGPPGFTDPSVEINPVIYGPPGVFDMKLNPMKVTTANKSVKAAKLAQGKKQFKKAITVKKAVGTVRFTKLDLGSSKRLSVNKKTGAVTVKKGTKKGLYQINVQVTAEGKGKYLPGLQVVTVKVRVK